MKNFKIWFFLLFVLSVLSGCGNFDNVTDKTEDVKTSKGVVIQYGSIDQKQEYVGQINPIQKTTISTEWMWKIKQINVKLGDKVTQGQTLAVMDSDEIQSSLNWVDKTIQTLTDLQASTVSFFDSQYKMTQNQVDQAKIWLDASKISSGWSNTANQKIKEIDLAISTYQAQLANVNASLDSKKTQLYQNAITTMQQSTILLESIWDFINGMMWISEDKKTLNDNYEIYLGAKNTTQKNSLENQRHTLNSKYSVIKSDIISLNEEWYNGSNEDKINKTLAELGDFAKWVRTMLKLAYNVVDSSVSSTSFPQTQIDNLKNQITQMQSNLENVLLTAQWSFILGIDGISQSIDSLNKETALQIDWIQKQIEILQQQKVSAISSTDDQHAILSKQYQEAQDGLDNINKQKNLKVVEIQAQIDQAKTQRQQLLSQANNTIVKAPYDWTITEKFIELGQLVSPGVPVFEISDSSLYEIIINIPSQEVWKFEIWQVVDIYLPSQDISLTGTISNVKSSADMFSKKVEIKIHVKTSKQITLWIFAKVYFTTSSDTWYLVPIDLVKYNFGKKYVFLANTWSDYDKVFFDSSFCNDDFCISKDSVLSGRVVIE